MVAIPVHCLPVSCVKREKLYLPSPGLTKAGNLQRSELARLPLLRVRAIQSEEIIRHHLLMYAEQSIRNLLIIGRRPGAYIVTAYSPNLNWSKDKILGPPQFVVLSSPQRINRCQPAYRSSTGPQRKLKAISASPLTTLLQSQADVPPATSHGASMSHTPQSTLK
jgi:hypothetical protein